MSYSRYYKCPLYKRNKFGNKDGLVLKTDFVFFFFITTIQLLCEEILLLFLIFL